MDASKDWADISSSDDDDESVDEREISESVSQENDLKGKTDDVIAENGNGDDRTIVNDNDSTVAQNGSVENIESSGVVKDEEEMKNGVKDANGSEDSQQVSEKLRSLAEKSAVLEHALRKGPPFTVMMSNLPGDVMESMIKEFLVPAKAIEIRIRGATETRGVGAFVDFEDEVSLLAAVEKSGEDWNEMKVKVEVAEHRTQRNNHRSGGGKGPYYGGNNGNTQEFRRRNKYGDNSGSNSVSRTASGGSFHKSGSDLSRKGSGATGNNRKNFNRDVDLGNARRGGNTVQQPTTQAAYENQARKVSAAPIVDEAGFIQAGGLRKQRGATKRVPAAAARAQESSSVPAKSQQELEKATEKVSMKPTNPFELLGDVEE
mmetsp:Transcript_10698/g.19320  ORF Transcript_10698/g.19320 Transcript_10698/m.19320 type:complete len:374 (+) Transcript_10698:43-1164(+)